MNTHYFNTKIASIYGIYCAILLQNILFWVEKNKANNQHYHDGHYWTYNSNKAFQEQFSYMNAHQIRSSLKTLQNEGLILTGNYNEGCDRTLWYTVTEKGYNILSGTEEPAHNPIVELEDIDSQSAPTRILEEKDEELPIPQNEPICRNEQNDLLKTTKRIAENDKTICGIQQNDLLKTTNGTNNKPHIKPPDNLEKEIYKEKEAQESVCLEIFNFWNSKKLLSCSELTENLKAIILSALKSFTLNEIKLCISRYDEMLNSPDFYFSHNWSLRSFLTQRNAIYDFTDTGEKWLGYSKWHSAKNKSTGGNFIHNNYTQEQMDSCITNLDEVVL